MCETSLRRIFIPPFQQLKEFRGHLAIWNCQFSTIDVERDARLLPQAWGMEKVMAHRA